MWDILLIFRWLHFGFLARTFFICFIVNSSSRHTVHRLVQVEGDPGRWEAEVGVATQEVELWWPNGHGGQTLYPLTVWVEDPGLDTVHSETKQVRLATNCL